MMPCLVSVPDPTNPSADLLIYTCWINGLGMRLAIAIGGGGGTQKLVCDQDTTVI